MTGPTPTTERRQAPITSLTFWRRRREDQQANRSRRAIVIINELAPHSSAGHWLGILRAALPPGTKLSEHRVRDFSVAGETAARAAREGVELIVAVGGDGTVNAIANGIAGTGARMAVMPAGTANDLARLTGTSFEAPSDPRRVGGLEEHCIDGLSVNGTHYYTVGGLGYVADVAATANRWRSSKLGRTATRAMGSGIYHGACIREIAMSTRLASTFRVEYVDGVDGSKRVYVGHCSALFVANFGSVGRSFTLDPTSDPADGLAEIIALRYQGRAHLVWALAQTLRGRLLDLPGVEVLRVKQAFIESDDERSFFGDGETLAWGRQFEVQLVPRALRIIAPRRAAESSHPHALTA